MLTYFVTAVMAGWVLVASLTILALASAIVRDGRPPAADPEPLTDLGFDARQVHERVHAEWSATEHHNDMNVIWADFRRDWHGDAA